ncbi:hypothetical protein ABN763_12055 [Spongiivirga sp. MCCC 1A20706]|uniref:hypothetical protein n=1 Tax=Spongiivirga sp. MCCC 1A20706 TaxID=3160963 RepID=UPI003977633B
MKYALLVLFLLVNICAVGQKSNVFPGADEQSPSRAQYFSWINNCNEGPTEAQTLINLDFFKWMQDEYGMRLDIYAFDAGTIDGKRFYGSTDSDRFKNQFPSHFDPVYKKAKQMGTRLGVWGGPDGFGDTPKEEKARIEQMVSLARDYEFELFKFDAVCGALRPEKQDAFVQMMTEVRKHSPDLILLDHRLDLGKGKPHSTTFLWGGDETYIDVHMANKTTGTHHRVAALSRGHTPDLKRLTEDHGVCISSCLDYWDDDLILQAFSRSLILAPEIYANPWFLRDDEFPKLARIYNLHRKYRNILMDAKKLPDSYGPFALARGNEKQRFVTLRNLSWESKKVTINLNEEIGLDESRIVEVRQFHPTEKFIANAEYGKSIEIEVLPFRSALIYVGKSLDEPTILGVNYQVIKDNDKETVVELNGMPGTNTNIQIQNPKFQTAIIDGKKQSKLSTGKQLKITFAEKKIKLPYHRKLNEFTEISVPKDVDALYEATVFSADNNALEVRSIQRSGWSSIPQVKKAQQAFFEQDVFINKGIWDKNLFDGDLKTGLNINHKWNVEQRIKGGCFRLDLGEIVDLDELRIIVTNEFDLQPQLLAEGNWVETSTDLINWTKDAYIADTNANIKINKPFRYLRIGYAPQRIVEVEGYKNGKQLNSKNWRASNLFAHADKMKAVKTWKTTFTPTEMAKGSYLCVALEGKHGVEGAYAAAKVNGTYIGAPDRAVSYQSNTWEYVNRRSDSNYTYYIPLEKSMIGKEIEVFVMSYDTEHLDFKPELYITTSRIPFEKKQLLLTKK